MERLDVEGFLIKNKALLLISFLIAAIAAVTILGTRYYYSNLNKKADAILWKGINSYMSYNGKNPEKLSDSISDFKSLQAKFGNSDATAKSDFYLGLDYMRMNKLNSASSRFASYLKRYPVPNEKNLSYLALSNLTSIALSKKDFKKAISYLTEMAKIDNVKLQEYAMLEKAAIYSEINEKGKAVSIYKSMLAGDSVTSDRGYIENLIQLNS